MREDSLKIEAMISHKLHTSISIGIGVPSSLSSVFWQEKEIDLAILSKTVLESS